MGYKKIEKKKKRRRDFLLLSWLMAGEFIISM